MPRTMDKLSENKPRGIYLQNGWIIVNSLGNNNLINRNKAVVNSLGNNYLINRNKAVIETI